MDVYRCCTGTSRNKSSSAAVGDMRQLLLECDVNMLVTYVSVSTAY